MRPQAVARLTPRLAWLPRTRKMQQVAHLEPSMRKQSLKILIITVFMLSTPTGVAADEPVDAALACFSQAWNHHDMRAFGECFAADADFVNVTTHW